MEVVALRTALWILQAAAEALSRFFLTGLN